jgi:ubiquinone/menaquinone biosynthesis C-methylase UbiE
LEGKLTYPYAELKEKFGYFNPGDLFSVKDREWKLLKLMKNLGINKNPQNYRVLDLGCGNATNLANFVNYGFSPGNLFGLDIRKEDVIDASKYHKHLNLLVADGKRLPFPDESFNIILTFTLFATILDEGVREKVAIEIMRILKKGGIVLWYDMRVDNPLNPYVKKVTLKEIKKLFPKTSIKLKSITLNPFITRKLVSFSHTLTTVLNTIPVLHTHLYGIIKKI